MNWSVKVNYNVIVYKKKYDLLVKKAYVQIGGCRNLITLIGQQESFLFAHLTSV